MCVFKINQQGLWYCTESGWLYRKKTTRPPGGVCKICFEKHGTQGLLSPPTEQQAAAEKQQAEAIAAGNELGWTEEEATKYAHVLVRWLAEGKPVRTDEEVAYCVELCKNCGKYQRDTNTCGAKQCKLLTPGLAIDKMARLGIVESPAKKW